MRAEPFQDVLKTLVSLGAERVLVLEGPPPYKLRAAYGIQENQPWSDQISLSLLEETIGQGTPLLLGDAQDSPKKERWSLLLNQVRSVLCVPFWTPSSRIAGILYADTRSKAGVFSRKALDAVQNCARALEASLYGGRPAREVPDNAVVAPDGTLGLRAPVTKRLVKPVAVAPVALPHLPRSLSVTVFYRSLATMIAAGLPLMRALDVLAQHQDDRGMQHVLQGVAAKVHGGSPLSQALSAYPNVFSSLYLQMVRVGETTGSLHNVLARIADHREKSQRTELQLRQALTYPAFIFCLCLVLLVLAPPFLLQGQFEMIRASGHAPPWPTRLLMLLSDFMRSPLVLLAPLAAVGFWRFVVPRVDWFSLAWRVGPLRRLCEHLLVARFASTLALTLRVGLRIDTGVRLAALGAGNPLLDARLPRVYDSIQAGQPLARSLEQAEIFPKLFLRMVSAGEESGKVEDLMSWVARFYERVDRARQLQLQAL